MLKGYSREEKKEVTLNELPALLTGNRELQQYNMTFDFRKKNFSGLLLIKETAPETYRLFFTTHFGLSIFDMELTPDSLHIYQCIEPLQKKQLFRLLERDFSILLGIQRKTNEPAITYTNPEKEELMVYKLTGKKNKGYFVYNKQTKQTEEILSGSGLGKTIFCHISSDDIKNKHIKINHCRLGITVTLQSIHRDHE